MSMSPMSLVTSLIMCHQSCPPPLLSRCQLPKKVEKNICFVDRFLASVTDILQLQWQGRLSP